jgi:polysaccharide export outer membrane protein
MKYLSLLRKSTPLLLLLFLFSCASRKDFIYYQGAAGMAPQEKSNSYEIKIQPDDLLMIVVSAEDSESVAAFNLGSTSGSSAASGKQSKQSYLVDSSGNIEFPILGTIKVGSLSRSEVLGLLKQRIMVYVKNPTINLRITNFKVAVQGEVASPGVYSISSDRVTLIEALSMAGDLTLFGKRNNILIIREKEGVKSFNSVDITNTDFMNSSFYYLAQNDVIYVETNKAKISGSTIGASTGLIFSVTSVLITVMALILR